jgi:hypothetical protein
VSDPQAQFDWAVGEIEAAYQRLGHRLGWRFLLSSRRTFRAGASTMLLSHHPGGTSAPPNQGRESCENGSAYLVESWHDLPPGTAPLQVQIQALLACLGVAPEETLAAYFVPFRAQDQKALTAASASHAFAVQLWGRLLPALHPQVAVVFGNEAYAGVLQVLGSPAREIEVLAGWGNVKARLALCGARLIVRLPDLSRFQLFSREEGRAAMAGVAQRVAAFRKGDEMWAQQTVGEGGQHEQPI